MLLFSKKYLHETKPRRERIQTEALYLNISTLNQKSQYKNTAFYNINFLTYQANDAGALHISLAYASKIVNPHTIHKHYKSNQNDLSPTKTKSVII